MLSACGPDSSPAPKYASTNMKITILKDSTTESDYRVLCIDGIKYIDSHRGGITAKWQANREGDPSVEECE